MKTPTKTQLFRAAVVGLVFVACGLLIGNLLLRQQSPRLEWITAYLLAGVAADLAGQLLWRREKREQSPERRVERLRNRLELIRTGESNVYLDYPHQDEIRELVEVINALTQERIRTVRTLQNERKKADYILDNMDSGLLLIGPDLTVQQCNTSAYKYLSVSGPLVGAKVCEVLPEEHFVRAVKNALEQEMSSVLDLDLTESSGAIVSVRVSPITGAWMGGGRGISATAILQNVTQTRQLERMRSEFVANVSHELKTPITSIKGFAELLLSEVVLSPEKEEEYLGRIHGEAVQMTHLIEDILRLSSLEEQNTQERQEPVDLAKMCEEVFHTLTPQMSSRHIEGIVRGRVIFFAYPDDMYQLLKNLIENAVKYNVEGGKVTVRLSEDVGSCVIAVSDTGIGIAAEHQPRIFERFYRVDKGRSKREGGTGLGLSIVKHVVAKYRGQLTLTSKVDVGTTIKAILPMDGER